MFKASIYRAKVALRKHFIAENADMLGENRMCCRKMPINKNMRSVSKNEQGNPVEGKES